MEYDRGFFYKLEMKGGAIAKTRMQITALATRGSPA
jgi:hypothetical protein